MDLFSALNESPPPFRGKPEPFAMNELYGYGSPLVCVRVGGSAYCSPKGVIGGTLPVGCALT